MLRSITFCLCIITTAALYAQDVREVTATLLNVRKGPGTKHAVIGQLKNGEQIEVLQQAGNWVEFKGANVSGFAHGKYLRQVAVAKKDTQETEMVIPDQEWEAITLQDGEINQCLRIEEQHNKELENFLRIVVSESTDVIVKLMNFYTRQCIRAVFIQAGNTFSIENIPEGQYFLKIAYGQEPGQIIENNRCKIRFRKNAIYEKGKEILNYNLRRSDGGYEVPSYELFLDVVNPHEGQRYEATKIDEVAFDN